MHKFCKGLVIFSHLKISAFTMAGIMIIWGFLAIGPSDSLFVRYLNYGGLAEEWGAAMFLNGIVLLLGCICPWRSGRHIGLALCCFQMMALGGFFFEMGLFTPLRPAHFMLYYSCERLKIRVVRIVVRNSVLFQRNVDHFVRHDLSQ